MTFDHAAHFRDQAVWCETLGSPFTAALLRRAADAFAAIGDLFSFRDDWRPHDASALRFAGALNAAVITGRAPALAALYPAPGRAADIDRVWPEALRVLAADRDWIVAFLHQAPQTNETRRAIALLPAFLDIAAGGGPLHMREVGASAGLNLNWDRFAYRTQSWTWGGGDPRAPVIDTDWRGPAPKLDAKVEIASRAGCDVHPLDVRDAAARARLKAYIWPDQFERVARFERAADLATTHLTNVAEEDAGAWLERQLSGDLPEGVTILYHSVAWQYFPAETDARGRAAILAAGARATPARRLAWVRFEHERFLRYPGNDYVVDVALWPGDGAFRPIAKVDPHLRWAELV